MMQPVPSASVVSETPVPGSASPPERRPWAWLPWSAAAGLPLGVGWWLLAPSGANFLSGNPDLALGTNAEAWFPRDLTLAALLVFAGVVASIIVLARGTKDRDQQVGFAVAGGLLGAAVAWGAGVVAGQWWGPGLDTAANASIAFSLRSFSVLVFWPATVAILTFVASLGALFAGRPATQGGQAQRNATDRQ